jgi:hypothetical protein
MANILTTSVTDIGLVGVTAQGSSPTFIPPAAAKGQIINRQQLLILSNYQLRLRVLAYLESSVNNL